MQYDESEIAILEQSPEVTLSDSFDETFLASWSVD